MTFPLTREFILELPKTDLHLHLDGSIRIPTLIELAKEWKAAGVETSPSETQATMARQFRRNPTTIPPWWRRQGRPPLPV